MGEEGKKLERKGRKKNREREEKSAARSQTERGAGDRTGNWHWVSEPSGFCDWNRNLWIFYPNGR